MSLKNIDTEALKLLVESDWIWSDIDYAFIKARDPMKENTEQYRTHERNKINYEELREHNLVNPKSTVSRDAGLEWLRKRVLAS